MIIDFNTYKDNRVDKITEEDILNLVLISKYEEPAFIDKKILMKSLTKYKDSSRYKIIYENVRMKKDEDGIPIIDLKEAYNKLIENNIIIEYSECDEFMIITSPEYILNLKQKYSKTVLKAFNDLMYFVNNDLRYGLDNWDLISEDELLNYPRYPSIVTGEFIDQEKDEEVMEKVRKKGIQKLRDMNK